MMAIYMQFATELNSFIFPTYSPLSSVFQPNQSCVERTKVSACVFCVCVFFIASFKWIISASTAMQKEREREREKNNGPLLLGKMDSIDNNGYVYGDSHLLQNVLHVPHSVSQKSFCTWLTTTLHTLYPPHHHPPSR